jgi:hypothetical protein
VTGAAVTIRRIAVIAVALSATINIADAKAPATTRDYVIYCQQAAIQKDCGFEIQVADVAINATILYAKGSGPGSCTPDFDTPAIEKATVQKVVAWIQAHPAVLSTKTSDGVKAAIRALWTCKQ